MIEWDRSERVALGEAAAVTTPPPETVGSGKILLALALIAGGLVLTFALMPASAPGTGTR